MKELHEYTLDEETIKEMILSNRYRPALKISFRLSGRQYTYISSAGYDDEIRIYQEQDKFFILSRNVSLEYLGLEIFSGEEKIGGVFLQGVELHEMLGKRDLAPKTIIKRLRSIFF